MSGRIASLHDGKDDKKGGKKDEKKKTGNSLYTGGTSSGLNVIGRGDDDDDDDDVASSVFKRAGEGVGDKPGTTVKFWKNGFTVGDGDLRRMDDPANAAFLKAITEGRVPTELREFVDADGDARVAFEDHRGEEYVPPAYRAYGGTGMKMGGFDAPAGAVASAAASSRLTVDEAAPKADIQVRLADGRREKVTLNLSHTVGDLQAKVASFKATTKTFVLLAGFPPRPLADASATIEAAGLKGAMVTQQAT